ncbi:MAG: ferrochelatase [Alphaproteobacteria bacterium]|jgi:protoporphyrin/coproporphyrin ferrochelatase|nr:ferrochelatase [Alphaproteobacteria bacterium]
MAKNYLPEQHPEIIFKTGVLILNLGTPEGYDYFSVRKYLKEFLSDQRVIEVNPLLWKVILHSFILPFRPFATGKKYKEIWFNQENASPLKYYTKSQAEKLQIKLNKKHPELVVDYAMRYGKPSIESKIKELQEKGCKKIIFIPLYPQYCAATTATICDEIYRVISKIRWQPKIKIADHYPDNKVYLTALATSIKTHLKEIDFKPDAILSSYHGIPKIYFEKGDPYPCYCRKTHRLLNDELKKQKIKLENHLSFQSRFGPKEWIKPYTEDVLKELIAKGVKNLIVITPGFAADCIETLEEVDMEYRELFLSLGGEKFSHIPCLNDSDDSIKLIENLVEENLI